MTREDSVTMDQKLMMMVVDRADDDGGGRS